MSEQHEPGTAEATSIEKTWLSDDPLRATAYADNDLLDRAPFVSAVADVIDRAQSPGSSSVFVALTPESGHGLSGELDLSGL
jgi:hypothetical protein